MAPSSCVQPAHVDSLFFRCRLNAEIAFQLGNWNDRVAIGVHAEPDLALLQKVALLLRPLPSCDANDVIGICTKLHGSDSSLSLHLQTGSPVSSQQRPQGACW